MSRRKIHRLLLVTSDYHYLCDGRVYTTSSFLHFVPELLRFAESLEVCAPVHPNSEAGGYSIEGGSIGYLPLPPSRTIERFVLRFPVDGPKILHRLYEGTRRADLVWINGPHPLLPLAAAVAFLLRKPYLLWLRGDILATVRSKYIGPARRDRMATRTAQYIEGLIRLSARGGAVYYTGSGLDRYGVHARYSQRANTSLVRETDLAKGAAPGVHAPLRLLWAGQLRPVKGLRQLLAAVHLLRSRGTEVSLTLVGSGEQEAELRAACAALGLDSAVSFEGYVPPGPRLSRYYEEADMYVLSSLSEGVPKVLLEAMARAMPVVATAVGGVPDVIRDGHNGLLVPAGSAEALAAAVERLATDADLRVRLSMEALRYAREHTSAAEVERIHAGLQEAYPALWGER